MKILIVISIIALTLVAGCTSQKTDTTPTADISPQALCIQLCQQQLDNKINLTQGPCLSNNITEGWVCDVAHMPRQEVDNNPANQCPEYGFTVNHFVEVGPDCSLIRAV